MKADYFPDGWVVLKINAPTETLYKVFASWGGGYVCSEHWKMNSGITKCTFEDNCYFFEGYSGSVYSCARDTYNRLNAYNYGILQGLIKDAKEKMNMEVFVMPRYTDWVKMDYTV